MKLVREYIFEKFEDESDPIRDMGIGAKYDVYLQDQFEPFLKEYQNKYSTYHRDPRKNNQVNPLGMKRCFAKFKEEIEPLILHKFIEGKMWQVNKGWCNKKIKVLQIKGQGSKTMFHPERNAMSYFHVSAIYHSQITGSNIKNDFGIYLKDTYHVTLTW